MARPHFGLSTEVQALTLLEDHVDGFRRWFINSADVD